MLLFQEMDYLKGSAKVTTLQKIRNTIIRSKMQAEQSILDRIHILLNIMFLHRC